MKIHDFFDKARLLLFVPMRALYWPLMLCPIKRNKIVFANFNGRGFGCNPKYICQALMESEKDLDLVWMTDKRGSLPKEVRNVSMKSLRALWEFATAKVWVCNNRLPYYIDKRRGQFYVHTWHGCLGFKKIERDIKNQPLYYVLRSKHDSKMIDLLTMNSRVATEYFRHCFYYDGPILEKGTPRNDLIINKDERVHQKVREYFRLENDTKILFYPPTFRQNQNLDVYRLPFEKILEALSERFGGKWVALVRLHPVVANKADALEYNEWVINASTYDDMQELISAADFMINDFSSGLIDFVMSGKPAVFYASDYEEYHKKDRDMFLSEEMLPCRLTKTEGELLEAIRGFEPEDVYSAKIDEFFRSVGLNETGRASQAVADIILEKIDGNMPK